MDQETVGQRQKRIAKNTLLLYARTLLTMGVGIYSVRVVLNTLGVNDYGLFHLIGGVVAILAFLPNSMASATQRDFSHALGEKDSARLERLFGVNTLIYLGIGGIALVILLTAGGWFIASQVQTPADRQGAALALFYFAAATFFVSILKSPMMAIIIAHEDMKLYAYMAISEATLKLATVIILAHLPGDKLVLYGALLFGIAIIDTTFHLVVCLHRYSECRIRHVRWHGPTAAEVIAFTGWTLFGQLTSAARSSAVTVLMGQYFPAAIIAARAIATNLAMQANFLAMNFNTSLYPPIIKAYAAGRREEMTTLVTEGSKAAFFLMWVPALPLYAEMDSILQLWLGAPPAYTSDFARLALIETLIFAISLPLTTAARAPGRMAAYESILGGLQLCILLISWLLMQAGYGPHVVFYVAIAINAVMFAARLMLVGHLTGLPVANFLRMTLPSITAVVIISAAITGLVHEHRPDGTLGVLWVITASTTVSALAIIQFGLGKAHRDKLLATLKRALRSTRHRP